MERDLGQAKNFIDLLSMIEAKTNGNLNDQEKQLLDHALFELRMNYVDETKKGDPEPEAGDENDEAADGEDVAPGPSDEESSS